MLEREKALDKIRKLLRLSKSSELQEAQNAAGKAAAIMAQHGIDSVEDIDPELDPVSDNQDLAVECGRSKKIPQWKWNLAWYVAESAQCKPCTYYRLADRKIMAIVVAFIGRRSDAELCTYLFQYLISEVNRIHDEKVPKIGQRLQIYVPGTPPQYVDHQYQKTWSKDFRFGAAVAIGERMRIAREQVFNAAASTSLVRLDDVLADVSNFASKLGIKFVDANQTQIHTRIGYDAGIREGRNIDLSRDHQALGEGRLKLRGSDENS